MIPGMLDSEMVEDTAKIVNEAIKDEVQAYHIINNRAGGNAPLIAEKIVDRLHSEKRQKVILNLPIRLPFLIVSVTFENQL